MTRLLLALAVVAVTARLLRRCDHAWRIYGPEDICDKCQRTRYCGGADDCKVEADDSEVVGMPTTWLVGDYGPETFSAADPLGPGWYVEFAPTSRN